jgi:hypothetical protein
MGQKSNFRLYQYRIEFLNCHGKTRQVATPQNIMDTPADFIFLREDIADRFNPFYQGEYLVIQTVPSRMKLHVEYHTHDYGKANSRCDIENFANDYTSFGVRIFHQGKLWRVNCNGEPVELSKQQNWQIHPDYLTVHRDRSSDGEIVVHNCSYPYFSALVARRNKYEEFIDIAQPLTCLQDDTGREINACPNCGYSLVEEDDDDEDEGCDIPIACIGCSNYHGEFYKDVPLVCGIHPYGSSDKTCPDFRSY